MDWQAVLQREAIRTDHGDHSLLYHAGLRPAVPPEYAVPGLVAVTFRLRRRASGGWLYCTSLDLAAAVRLGDRIGLPPGEAVALVDSHERIHVALQSHGVSEHEEEAMSRVADAVWLSLHHPVASAYWDRAARGLVHKVGPGFWEALVDAAEARAEAQRTR